jgi:hypothetical protein
LVVTVAMVVGVVVVDVNVGVLWELTPAITPAPTRTAMMTAKASEPGMVPWLARMQTATMAVIAMVTWTTTVCQVIE